MIIFCNKKNTERTSEREYVLLVEWLYMAQMVENAYPEVGFPISKEILLGRLPIGMSDEVRDEVICRYNKKYKENYVEF